MKTINTFTKYIYHILIYSATKFLNYNYKTVIKYSNEPASRADLKLYDKNGFCPVA